MPMRADSRIALLAVLAGLAVASCGGGPVRDGPPTGRVAIPDLPGDAVPRAEPPSRYGNGPEYEVFGQRYRVMPSSEGYRERGVASWYGKKFHGRLTSSREPYDMYAMTAAHKSLPLPTYVRVRNLRNDKSVVVRVNDRGPFVHNRIIDLSYAAAMKLDMVEDGTSLVEVTAISFDAPAGDHPTRATSAEPPADEPVDAGPPATPAPGPSGTEPAEHQVFVQVGAFGSRENAERRHAALRTRGLGNAFIYTDTGVVPTLYRVRIGPIVDGLQYDLIVEELEVLGIDDPYLVTVD
jgi:rare lipoprotein A